MKPNSPVVPTQPSASASPVHGATGTRAYAARRDSEQDAVQPHRAEAVAERGSSCSGCCSLRHLRCGWAASRCRRSSPWSPAVKHLNCNNLGFHELMGAAVAAVATGQRRSASSHQLMSEHQHGPQLVLLLFRLGQARHHLLRFEEPMLLDEVNEDDSLREPRSKRVLGFREPQQPLRATKPALCSASSIREDVPRSRHAFPQSRTRSPWGKSRGWGS